LHGSGSSNQVTNKKSPSLYDPMKADLFSAATTLFLMVMRCPPFRKAHQKDPYFKRLCASDRKAFWNIFKSLPSSHEFKDLFESLTKRDPEERLTLKLILNHQWLLTSDRMNEKELIEDITKRYEVLEKQGLIITSFQNSQKDISFKNQPVDSVS
jgi:serine/threonine protein kinase